MCQDHHQPDTPALATCRSEIESKLKIGRSVFLVVVIAEFVGLFLAMLMRNMSTGHNPYRCVSSASVG